MGESDMARDGWSEGMLDAFRMAECLFGAADAVSPELRSALDARGSDARALAKRVAARVRPAPTPERLVSAPARVRALLGAPGAAPRRRYAPPPGLADTLRRLLRVSPRRADGTELGRARRRLATIHDEALYARALGRLGAEEAGAVQTLRELEAGRDARGDLLVKAFVLGGLSLEAWGAMVAGFEGAAGDGPARAGRELRALDLPVLEVTVRGDTVRGDTLRGGTADEGALARSEEDEA
ncbi:MAG: hypothetical protein H6721_13205 [Sandaracinus sp.]|nr:hypothetical protein [Sandaracinus sp.]MCB9633072.1 hypothetical protein [Sandaracinus sp.]